ncbi:MAG: hypothetical protein HY717_07190 [Planctomycetes bacterium]|nr:hypothetical protein [Planctomycetota bacterium]
MKLSFRSILNSAKFSTILFIAMMLNSSCSQNYQSIRNHVMVRSGRVYELKGEGDSRILVAPSLQGRILTTKVGAVESAGFLCLSDIAEGEVHEQFNNFGGQDRFWIGPEAGSFGIYFKPGEEVDRKHWKVPDDLNKGPMEVVSANDQQVVLSRGMAFTNYLGNSFKAKVQRELGSIPAQKLNEEIGLPLPAGLSYAGSYSLNTLTNAGEAKWEKDKGLLCIWILGQFNAGPKAVIIGPFKPGDSPELGPRFNDDYFGKVSVETPERFKVVGNAVLFRADAQKEGKFGIGARRSTGFAGAYDREKSLLILVKFDVHAEGTYASFSWAKDNPKPYTGDAFQSYNSDSTTPEGSKYPFFELESVSPVKELAPGESLVHRHATFCFQGEREQLKAVAEKVLGVSLEEIEKYMP